jgi:hypothetical protein
MLSDENNFSWIANEMGFSGHSKLLGDAWNKLDCFEKRVVSLKLPLSYQIDLNLHESE